MTAVADALGRRIDLAGPPARIVSLVPSLTEYIFWLGLGDRVVGATDYCIEPAAELAAVPRVRGTKNPDRAAIAALRPDLVIANKEENRERDIAALAEAGLNVYVTDIAGVAEARATLAVLAALLDRAAAAAPLLAEIDAELARAPKESVRVIAAIWRDPWMLVGAGTYADDLLRQAGAINPAAALAGRYPRVTLAEMAALGADVLLLPDEPYRFGPDDLPAVGDVASRAILCDGMALTWYGPRIPAALRAWRALLGGDARDGR